MLAVLVLGCSFPTSAPPEEDPAAATKVPEVELVYVQASMLRLREHPTEESAFSPLAINSRVRVLERDGEWMRVLAPDGRSGWVHRDYVAMAPLTPQLVQERYQAAKTPEDRVLWAERASALSPGDAGLVTTLIAEYKAAGREDDAKALAESQRAEESDRFDRMFPAQRGRVAEVSARLAGAQSAEQVIAVWRDARELTAAMGEPLAAVYDSFARVFLDGDPTAMLAERMPWATVAIYAEGTVPALELAPRPWVDAAARTPEPWDDGFFSLVTTAYENASARGWTAWQRRSWDYGGCSPFGNGENLHLALLLQTDTLGDKKPVADTVAQIRAGVLRDIEKPVPDEFAYCDGAGKPTPTEGLLNEARRILAEVKLTPEERAMIERRVAASFGR